MLFLSYKHLTGGFERTPIMLQNTQVWHKYTCTFLQTAEQVSSLYPLSVTVLSYRSCVLFLPFITILGRYGHRFEWCLCMFWLTDKINLCMSAKMECVHCPGTACTHLRNAKLISASTSFTKAQGKYGRQEGSDVSIIKDTGKPNRYQIPSFERGSQRSKFSVFEIFKEWKKRKRMLFC